MKIEEEVMNGFAELANGPSWHLLDDLLEEIWHKDVQRLNITLAPCPSCSGRAYLSICDWMCCKASIRYIECDCGVFAGPSIEEWNNRTAEIRNFYQEIKELENEKK